MIDALYEALSQYVAGVSDSCKYDLKPALTRNSGKTVDVAEQQVGALILRHSARKTNQRHIEPERVCLNCL